MTYPRREDVLELPVVLVGERRDRRRVSCAVRVQLDVELDVQLDFMLGALSVQYSERVLRCQRRLLRLLVVRRAQRRDRQLVSGALRIFFSFQLVFVTLPVHEHGY